MQGMFTNNPCMHGLGGHIENEASVLKIRANTWHLCLLSSQFCRGKNLFPKNLKKKSIYQKSMSSPKINLTTTTNHS